MASRMIAAAVGIGSVAWFPGLPSLWLLGFAFTVCAALRWRGLIWASLPLALISGLIYGSFHGHLLQTRLLPGDQEGRDLALIGVVASIPDYTPHRGGTYRFDFRVESWEHVDCCRAERLRLSFASDQSVKAGQRWHLRVRLKRPRGYANPGGFDYARWLVAGGRHASGYVREGEQLEQTTTLRADIVSTLRERLQRYEQSAILLALAVGDRAELSECHWTLFRHTGTAHLMAISGLHIGIAAGLGFLLGRLLSFRVGSSALLALSLAFAYAWLAGFALPSQRAFLMVAVAVLALSAGRAIGRWRSWSAALLIILCVQPLASLTPGFWLSFGAVAVLLMVFERERGLRSLWAAQWKLLLGLTPLTLLFFQQLSLLSLPVNLVAVPLFSLLIIPLVLLALVCEALSSLMSMAVSPGIVSAMPQPVWQAADFLLSGVMISLDYLLENGAALVQQMSLSGAQLAALAVALLLLMLPAGAPARYLFLLALLPVIMPFWADLQGGPENPELAEGDFRLQVLDVGQGLSVLVFTREHTLVYDVGPRYSHSFDLAEAAVLPALRSAGVAALDRVIISHRDNDHAGAYLKVLKAYPQARLLSGQALPGAESCQAGLSWRWNAVDFRVLHPNSAVSSGSGNSNNQSCVLLISSAQSAALLPGDIESEVESRLLDSVPQNIDVLLAPHHGSKTSSSVSFVQRLSPSWVVFSAGYKHHFGHPAAVVRQRYHAVGSRLMNTAQAGMLSFHLSPHGLVSVQAYRDRHRFYWY